MLVHLWERTPFLLGGYGFNLLIAALAMTAGTVIGLLIALARHARTAPLRLAGEAVTSLCRNIPSFVLMFYVAFVFPVELEWGGTLVQVPLWIKATFALIIPVIGFASDQGGAYLRQKRKGQPDAGAVFVTAWVQYYLIVLMASATASVIGADEVVGRANRVIAVDNSPGFLLLTYSYVCLWFLVSGLGITGVVRWLEVRRYHQNAPNSM